MMILYFENRKIVNYFDSKKTSNYELFLDTLTQIKNNTLQYDVVLYWNSEKDLWNILQNHTNLIEAAGGVVHNLKEEILLIHRNLHWDLPKGKREHNEDLIQNAIREIEEETGIQQLVYKYDLDITYHLYYIEEVCILKKTYWYVFESSYETTLQAQIEEGITEVKWISIKNIEQYTDTMFLLIKDLLKKYLEIYC